MLQDQTEKEGNKNLKTKTKPAPAKFAKSIKQKEIKSALTSNHFIRLRAKIK